MDPPMGSGEQVLGGGRFGTDIGGIHLDAGPRCGMVTRGVRRHRCQNRVWAIEGCERIGRHVARRPIAQGEAGVDVPARLSAPVRVLATGQGRKTDDTDTTRSPWSACA
jgi:transposase